MKKYIIRALVFFVAAGLMSAAEVEVDTIKTEVKLPSGRTRLYSLNNQEIRLKTDQGLPRFMLSDLQSISLSEAGRVSRFNDEEEEPDNGYIVKTRHGDVLSGRILTQKLNYMQSDKLKQLYLNEMYFDEIVFDSGKQRKDWPQDAHQKLIMDDNSRIIFNPGNTTFSISQKGRKMNLPLGSVSVLRLAYDEKAKCIYGGAKFPSGIIENFELTSRRAKIRIKDSYGNDYKIPCIDIKGLVGSETETESSSEVAGRKSAPLATLVSREGKSYQADAPFTVWRVDCGLGAVLIPSPSIKSISWNRKSSEYVLSTLFGDILKGKIDPDSLELEDPSVEDSFFTQKIRDLRTVILNSEPALPIYQNTFVFTLKSGDSFIGRINDSSLSMKLSGAQAENILLHPMNIMSVAPTDAGRSLAILLKNESVVRGRPRESGFSVTLLVNGSGMTVAWPDIVTVSAAGFTPPANWDAEPAKVAIKKTQPVRPTKPKIDRKPEQAGSLFGWLGGGGDMEKEQPREKEPVKKRTPDPQQKPVRTAEPTADRIQEVAVPKLPRIRAGLELKVVVMASGRKEVEENEKRVSASGQIKLPLVGSVAVAGLTIEELNQKLKELYAEYLQNPMIDVDFVTDSENGNISPWGYVTVLGRVKEPGRINIPPTRDLTLSMAIQLAGGMDTSAKMTGIKITREENRELKIFTVDLESVGSKGKVEGDTKLQANDVIYIPEKVF